MKDAFPWYFPPTKEEYAEIWRTAYLTVDTNVLLDLYRRNPEMRDLLLTCLRDFTGRAWLTRQAAEEFIRHRQEIVHGVTKTFADATRALQEISAASRRLTSFHLLPKDFASHVEAKVSELVSGFVEQVETSRESHPNYRDISTDVVLKALCEVFADVGPPLSEQVMQGRMDTGKNRYEHSIPPGYCDHSKPETHKYGDYLLWAEVLDFARDKHVPVVLVTSEKKQDWWEEFSGQTTGPRRELLREAFEYSGHRILIYQPQQFAEMAIEMRGERLEPKLLEEIKDVQELPVKRRPEKRRRNRELEFAVADAESALTAGEFKVAQERSMRGLESFPDNPRLMKLYAEATRERAWRDHESGNDVRAKLGILAAIETLNRLPQQTRRRKALRAFQLALTYAIASHILQDASMAMKAVESAELASELGNGEAREFLKAFNPPSPDEIREKRFRNLSERLQSLIERESGRREAGMAPDSDPILAEILLEIAKVKQQLDQLR